MVRAANVSAALRRAGYAVQMSSTRQTRGVDGIRVRQSGDDATVTIWHADADELVEEIRELLNETYKTREYPAPDGCAVVWVSPKGATQ